MSRRVAITGLGLITPLGHSAWSNWKALLNGKTVADRLIPHPDFPGFTDELDLVQKIGSVSLTRHASEDPALQLMERASREAMDMAGLSTNLNHVEDESRLPTWIGSSKGGMHHYLQCLSEQVHDDQEITPSALFPVDHLSAKLCERLPLSIHGQHIAACASSLIAFIKAAQAIEDGIVDRALVISAEAALLPLFIHSYQRMGALAPLIPAEYQARPLDLNRNGFTLCETGVAVILENAPSQSTFAWFEKGSMGCDAHHIVNNTPGRVALKQIASAILPGDEPINLLHPHATGTIENDEAELLTLDTILRDSQHVSPDLYACKGAYGHAMGSSGLMAIVLACLAAKTHRRPAMKWIETPIDLEMIQKASPLSFSDTIPRRLNIRRQALFAAGFGGHVAGVSLLSQ